MNLKLQPRTLIEKYLFEIPADLGGFSNNYVDHEKYIDLNVFYETKNNEYPTLNFRSDLNGNFLNLEIPKKKNLNKDPNEETNKLNGVNMNLKNNMMHMNPMFLYMKNSQNNFEGLMNNNNMNMNYQMQQAFMMKYFNPLMMPQNMNNYLKISDNGKEENNYQRKEKSKIIYNFLEKKKKRDRSRSRSMTDSLDSGSYSDSIYDDKKKKSINYIKMFNNFREA